MSGNFAIKGGGGRTPNGKCHLKFPFWFFAHLPKQMLEKVFCSNMVPPWSSGNHLFHKIKYRGWSCLRQVGAITFDWSTLSTGNKHFWTAFCKQFSGTPHFHLSCHLAPENSGARCRHLAPGTSPKLGKWGIPEKSFQNAVQKCLF